MRLTNSTQAYTFCKYQARGQKELGSTLSFHLSVFVIMANSLPILNPDFAIWEKGGPNHFPTECLNN